MTEIIKNKMIVVLSIALTLAIGFAAYTAMQYSLLLVRTEWAQEQVAIFADMRGKAVNAKPKDAVGYLKYTIEYYPSGTKQLSGSALDLMVEQVRFETVHQIIADLRSKTENSLGDDPENWIAKYGSN
jgi:hypothetical protein